MRQYIILLLLLLLPLGYTQNSNTQGNAQIFSGQQAVTGTAAALASQALKTICIKALHANSINIYIGPAGVTTSTGMEMLADQSWCGNVTNANVVFVVASTTGASVSWVGTN